MQKLIAICGGSSRTIVVVAVENIGDIETKLREAGANHVASTKVVDGQTVRKDQFTTPGGVVNIITPTPN